MTDRWLNLLILIPVLLLSMMFHELAHGWIAYRLGDPTAKNRGRLSLNPLKHLDPLGTAMFIITYLFSGFVFGWAKPIPVSPYYFKDRQRGMAIVGAAGPITNLILAVIFILLLNWIQPAVDSRWFLVFFLLFQINIVLGLFNLIPIPPLDGSRIVGAFLPRNAYEKWVAIDRYGIFVVFIFIWVFRNQFFDLMRWVIMGIAEVFLTNYTFV
ncbi:MAG: site-2 protease family protein [Actinobacteria bacterium]|nr:site-2 protease family protein [Actinomycetota bacterium]